MAAALELVVVTAREQRHQRREHTPPASAAQTKCSGAGSRSAASAITAPTGSPERKAQIRQSNRVSPLETAERPTSLAAGRYVATR